MDLAAHFRAMARNNAWSNARLARACARLDAAAFAAPRTGFFASLRATVNHILIVDWYYIDALERGGRGRDTLSRDEPFDDVAGWAAAQAASDRRLIAFCDGLDAGGLARAVTIERETRLDRERVDAVLAHLFVHQIHHRGQAHAMLSDTQVAPPQLDEFFLAADAPLRAGEPFAD